MANLEVDATDLANDGEEFTKLATTAGSIGDYLARGSALITFPDDDPISTAFKAVWDQLTGGVGDLLTGFKVGMEKVSSNVLTTAALYYKSNEVNTDTVPSPPSLSSLE
jgi:hypothetical protein